MLRGRFLAIQVYLKKQEKNQINNLTLHLRQLEKGEINSNTIIVGGFDIPLTPMDRSTKQKISKETQTLNDTIDQLDLIDIYRTFHPKQLISPFSQAHMETSPG